MAADKIGVVFTNQISGADRIRAEAQMRDGNRAGFFRVINKITLSEYSVASPIILMVFLLALTVPSLPKP